MSSWVGPGSWLNVLYWALFWWVDEVKVAYSGYCLAKASHSTERPKGKVIGKYPSSFDAAKTFTPLRLSETFELKNRIIRAAAFGGSTVHDLIQCHTEVARGGVGMTTVAYACVSGDGRTFRQQLMLDESVDKTIRGKLTQITDAVHACGAAVSIQLTHGGGFADPNAVVLRGGRTVAPSSVFNPAALNFPDAMGAVDISRVLMDFVNAAKLCKEAGFDCVELHCGHGYLLSQFISPYTNRRTDKYGGSTENRVRYPAEVLAAVREAVGPNFPVIVKFNVHDGFEQGVSMPDVVFAAKEFERAGASMLVPSGGFVSRNGLYMLRGDVPLLQMAKAMPGMLKSFVTFLLGPLFVPTTRFEECFFRREARLVKAAVERIPVALIGGVTSLSTIEGALEEGFGAVQMARALIHNPMLIKDMKDALMRRHGKQEGGRADGGQEETGDVGSGCTHCNLCVVSTLDPSLGMRCVLRKTSGGSVGR